MNQLQSISKGLKMKAILFFVVFSTCVISAFVNRSCAQVSEFDLANGVHVVVNSVEEAFDVGVETVYEVGFVDEPEAMVQSAHLLEHLVCYAPGDGFESKQAMQWLNREGIANAETMPDFTHYDYASTADNLEMLQKMGRDESRSLQMVLVQDALQRCTLRRLLGPDVDQMMTDI